MGATAADIRMEAMLAYQDRVTKQIDIFSAETAEESKRVSKQIGELSEESKRVSKQMDKLTAETAVEWKRVSKEIDKVNLTSKSLSYWGQGQRKCYEQLTCGALQRFLEREGYTNIYVEEIEKYRKTGYFVKECGDKVDATEWDGLIKCNKGDSEVVFLLEAKKTQRTSDMLTMPERIDRTIEFIEACKRNHLPGPGQRQSFKDLCWMWSRCSGHSIRGVLAADIIPPTALTMCEREGYLTIQVAQGMFCVADSRDGASISVTPEDADLAAEESSTLET